MRGFAVHNYYNNNRSIVYIMVITKIGNPIIPDTSEKSRALYERAKKLSDEYGVHVVLLPAKGTQDYADWYTNSPRKARSGILIEKGAFINQQGNVRKNYQYPKNPTFDWLEQKMAKTSGVLSDPETAARLRKTPRIYNDIIKVWTDLVDKGATITAERKGEYILRYGTYTSTLCEGSCLTFNCYPDVAQQVYALYRKAQETARLRALAKTHGLQ